MKLVVRNISIKYYKDKGVNICDAESFERGHE